MWETIKEIASEFANNTGLAIVRTIAFFVLGLVIIKIVKLILRSVTLKSRLDSAASTFVISIVTIVLYIALVIALVSSRQPAKEVPNYAENLTPQEELDKLFVPKLTIFVQRDRGTGRPTKRERREIDSLMEEVYYDEDFDGSESEEEEEN